MLARGALQSQKSVRQNPAPQILEHIRLLSERHLLEQHPNPIAKNCFVASRFARILLAKHSLHYGPAPYVRTWRTGAAPWPRIRD